MKNKFEDLLLEKTCWSGYRKDGMKKGKKGNMVPNCVPEVKEGCECDHV